MRISRRAFLKRTLAAGVFLGAGSVAYAGGYGRHGIDIAHYDSDKSYQGREFAYPIIWNALKPGGLFISDDIQDNMAFAHFVEESGLRYGVTETGGKYVGIALKSPA